jgi:hypothetical protein
VHIQLLQCTLEVIGRRLFGDNQRLGYASIRKSLRRQLSDFSLAPRELGRGIAHARGPVGSRIADIGGFQHTLRPQQSASRVFRLPRLFAKRAVHNAQPVLRVRTVGRPDSAAQSRQCRITSPEQPRRLRRTPFRGADAAKPDDAVRNAAWVAYAFKRVERLRNRDSARAICRCESATYARLCTRLGSAGRPSVSKSRMLSS